MKNTYIIFLSILCVINFSCKEPKGHICPSFDKTTLNTWLPYTIMGAKHTFANDKGETEVLNIKSYNEDFKRAITPSVGFNLGVEYCLAEGYIYSDTSEPNSVSLYIAHLIERFDDGKLSDAIILRLNTFLYVPIVVNNNTLTVSQESAWGIVSKTLPKLNTPNRVYANVLAFTFSDSTKATKANADKFYIAKGYGIIGYRSYPDGRQYWLQ